MKRRLKSWVESGLLVLLGALGAAAQTTAVPTPVTLPTPSLVAPSVIAPAQTPDSALLEIEPQLVGQGVLVETSDGRVVFEHDADRLFNPASAIKLATALAALDAYGPQHRFITVVWTDGVLDPQTGTIAGDLIVSGRDPSFYYEHAMLIACELNRLGVRQVTGDLVVAPKFTMNFDSSAVRSGRKFRETLDATRRSATATRAWREARLALGDVAGAQATPSVAIAGETRVGSVPASARPLLTHRSSALVDVLKVLLCYSNNFMAERLGDMLGGVAGLSRYLITKVGLDPSQLKLASTSGLGINRLSARAMMKIYRALLTKLTEFRLSPTDILPVAGVDPGTLQRRYAASPSRGSVIAKTGTLPRSDGGVSALVGELRTARGETLLFVIFNQRGSVVRFRHLQDRLVATLQQLHGGPAPFEYAPRTLAMKLVQTELDASLASAAGDEYEPVDN